MEVTKPIQSFEKPRESQNYSKITDGTLGQAGVWTDNDRNITEVSDHRLDERKPRFHCPESEV
jgi:hypothetical protein